MTLKTLVCILFLLFSPLVFGAPIQDEAIHPLKSNGTTAPAFQAKENTSELSSLPASITRYMATRQSEKAGSYEVEEPYGKSLCALPGFKCIRVGPHDTWYQRWHNEHQREIVMRLNRTNVALKYRHWLLVPDRMSHLNYMQLSPFPEHIKSSGHKLLLVDLRVFAFAAYNAEGNLVYWGPATGGQKWCSDTKEDCRTAVGRYKIYRIQGENCKSSKYPFDTKGGAPMPYCMHYYKGFAIHGSTLSGFNNRSRGCVRVFYSDAKWLNKNFVKLGTRVIVKR